LKTGIDKQTGETRTATVTGIRLTNAQGHEFTFHPDPSFNHAPD
jgi:hypothetical protein